MPDFTQFKSWVLEQNLNLNTKADQYDGILTAIVICSLLFGVFSSGIVTTIITGLMFASRFYYLRYQKMV